MSLIPLKLPAGVYRNGTDLDSSGRWRDTNLVRWDNGSLRPVGGWRTREVDAFAKPPRGMLTWQDNSDDRWIGAGTYEKLYVATAAGIVSDITPVGLTVGIQDAALNLGYGGGFYGGSTYGTSRPDISPISEATAWALDSWGEYMVGCSTADGKLYEWTLATGTPAAVITNAPTGCSSLIVTEERFLMALGAGSNPRKVQWSDREDNTTWTATAENEAGDIELQTSGAIQCGVKMRGRTLILTDTDAHAATYQGPPYVFGIERVGTACGVVSRQAVAAIDEGAFWMGQRGFFTFNGSSVQEIPCDVLDYVFDDMNGTQVSKIHAVHNGQHGEIWWFYPSASGLECDRYVAFDYKENHWITGNLNRTAGVDNSVFRYPLWIDSSGNLYEHEVGTNYDDDVVYAETGPLSLGSGEQIMSVNKLIPDEKTQGGVNITFKTRFHPNDTERTYGPYTADNPTSVRFTGRQLRMRVEGARLSNWRVGTMRIEALPRGRR